MSHSLEHPEGALKSPQTSARTAESQPRTPPSLSKKPKAFYIQPPQLEETRKNRYVSAEKSSLVRPIDMRIDEVIGEYVEKGVLYYYARYQDGIAHKFSSQTFLDSHPELVLKYEQKKQEGTLAPFDPTATYIHPLSRAKLTVSLPRRSMSVPSSEVIEVRTSSEDSGGDGEEEYDEDEDEAGTRTQPSRSAKTSKVSELPFSPRKTRSRAIVTIDSESDGSAILSKSRPTRRSTRKTKATEIWLDSDDEDYDDDSGYRSRKREPKQAPKVKKVKTIPPMYGRVRDVSTIDDDPFSDDDGKELLRAHRFTCERCHQEPAHTLLEAYKKKVKKGKKRAKKEDDFEEDDDEDFYMGLGGWVQCLRCPVATHWKCIAQSKRDEILKAIKDQEKKQREKEEGSGAPLPPSKKTLDFNTTTEFICGACERGGVCMGCMDAATPLPSTSVVEVAQAAADGDVVMQGTENNNAVASQSDEKPLRELLFRCLTCKRPAHYQHLPRPPSLEDATEDPVLDVASHYQSKSWLCADCVSFRYSLDKILAWRPWPPNAVQPTGPYDRHAPLPREYLVKWVGRSYRRLDWVPHMWLSSTAPSKLKNFLIGGTKVDLVQGNLDEDDVMDVDASSGLFETKAPSPAANGPKASGVDTSLSALPDAERRIPPAWKTVDRVLDILIWRTIKPKVKKQNGNKRVVVSESEVEDEDIKERDRLKKLAFEKGEQPPESAVQILKQWESEHDREITEDDIDEVAWIFAKWEDIGYEEATWDAPPSCEDPGYGAFQNAFKKYLASRQVLLRRQDAKFYTDYDKRRHGEYRKYVLKDAADLDLGQPPNLKLMPFQVDGFNWLCNNWWNHQHCILADEMGLGKTVQIATFLGQIIKKWKAFPALVVVPNSTLTNWVREFERWAPALRVVPFYGEKDSRDIVKSFELYHSDPPKNYTATKFHILVTTYEALINPKDFNIVFKKQPRWEVLVVDEGQRLKSDSSLLFRKLNELKTIHRIIMTGTPLNNNIRELFNLMNFLDPTEWKDLEALEKQHEELDDELVKQLHTRLRPYFLRRIKSEVLDLPPKNEVIVPISMAPLQKQVYRSILSHNVELLQNLTQPSATKSGPTKGRINNVLMELRKCLQHPYLYAEDIEPKQLGQRESHNKLIDGSGKLRFLKSLLAKLKQRGHRVLLFSQFVIALNIIEDFLAGEGYKFLRLDGNTKGKDRQKYMDEFNKPNSEYFIFLLTTRAGGVGINLFSADTVIIYDPDFNPHQDLQAIARAYRYGQQKTCLVFKLMVKDSAEERIMQIGKKKLVLDHLIVQKMDDDEENGGENIQSILTYGAKALFESDQASKDITYSDTDIDKLIEKTEKEAVKEGPKGEGGFEFSFAKIWAAEKDDLEEVQEEDQTDSWANTLEKINIEHAKEREKKIAESGRGARRKAATLAQTKMTRENQSFGDSPQKKHITVDSDGSAYADQGDIESDDNGSDLMDVDVDSDYIGGSKGKARAIEQQGDQGKSTLRDCTLCGERHGAGQCLMVNESHNLAEYRLMLIVNTEDEPWEERNAAVTAIDEILHRRGRLDLIRGQPLRPVRKPVANVKPTRVPSASTGAPVASGSGTQPKPKPKTVVQTCAACGQGYHSLRDCPIVTAGSQSISRRILELQSQTSAPPNLVENLLKYLGKAKAQERSAES